MREHIRTIIRVVQGDTRNLNYSSCRCEGLELKEALKTARQRVDSTLRLAVLAEAMGFDFACHFGANV